MAISEEEIRTHLLSWNEFNPEEVSDPHIFTIEGDGQQLLFFGMRHSFDPNDSVFETLRSRWNLFLQTTDRESAVVIVEGEERPLGQTERDAIVNKGGEGGFITYLANAERIPRSAPEPNTGDLLDVLAEKYPKRQVLYYYAAQIIHQWNNLVEQPDFADYLHYFLQEAQRETGWNDTNFTLDSVKSIHKQLFDVPFDHTNDEFFSRIVNQTKDASVINEISREADLIKDTAVVKSISEYWEDGKDIFVVYGIGHAIMQEPALKEVLSI